MRWLSRFFILLAAVITACGQAIPNSPTPEPTLTATAAPPTPTATPDTSISGVVVDSSPAAPGMIRVVHAAADTPSINIVAGVRAIVTNLSYTGSTEPTPLDAGEYTINIVASGSRPNDPALLESSFVLEGGQSLMLVVAKQDGQLTLLTFPETVEPLNPGESIVSVINTIEGATNIQVTQDSSAATEAVSFGERRTSGILPSGETTLNIQAGDFEQQYDVTLQDTRDYTLILTGTPEQIEVISISSQAPGRATVRVVHASAALGAVDVYVDENKVASNTEFGRPTSRQNLISGQYIVNVYEAGAEQASSTPLITQVVELQAGANTALILLGSQSSLMLVPYQEDLSPTPPEKARIAFLNTLDTVQSVHLETSGGPLPDFRDMRFGDLPQTTLLTSDSHNFYLTQPDSTVENQTVETIQNVQLEAGTYYLFLITGRQDNQPIILSDDVGIDETLSPEAISETAQNTDNPAHIRFVNALGDQSTLDFQVNGMTVSGITYGTGSALVDVAQAEVALSVSSPGSADNLQSLEETLESGGSYTVVAYGSDQSRISLMLLSDDGLVSDGRSPYLRLINLSTNNDVSIGLGFAPLLSTPVPGATFPPFEDVRRSMPGGIQRLVENILGGNVSSIILMPVGMFDIVIIDTATNQLANIIPALSLEAGAHYDIIAYEDSETTKILTFVVQYPANSE